MALGFYRAKYHDSTYYFKGLEKGFCWGHKNPWHSYAENEHGHNDEMIVNRTLLIPHQLLTFNTKTDV